MARLLSVQRLEFTNRPKTRRVVVIMCAPRNGSLEEALVTPDKRKRLNKVEGSKPM